MKKVLWIMIAMVLTLPVLAGCGVRGDLTLPEKSASEKELMDKKTATVEKLSHEDVVKEKMSAE